MPDTTKNVFISHVHEDDAGLGKIKDLLGQAGVTIRDSSINSDKPNNAKSPDYIKRDILAPAIDWAGVFICYVTPKTKESEWVTWEKHKSLPFAKHGELRDVTEYAVLLSKSK